MEYFEIGDNIDDKDVPFISNYWGRRSSGGFSCGGSAGAVFNLIASDGKADRLIMATSLLNQRIKEIRDDRRKELTKRINSPMKEFIDYESKHARIQDVFRQQKAALRAKRR